VAIEDPYWVDANRQDELRSWVASRLALADYLLRTVVPAMGDRYDGTSASIHKALSDPVSPVYIDPHDRIPLNTIRGAITIHRKHRPDLLDDYIARAKVPTHKGYMDVLRKQMPLNQI
jgi:hypothetical protein